MRAFKVIVAIGAVAFAAYVIYHFHERRQLAELNNRAVMLLDQDQFQEAADLLEQARRTDSENASVWKNLGIAYEGLKQYGRAVQAFERSLALDPTDTVVRNHIAQLKPVVDSEKAEIRTLEEQIRENPDNVEMLTKLGYSYEHLGDFDRAIELYERSLKKNPDQPDVIRRLEALRNPKP